MTNKLYNIISASPSSILYQLGHDAGSDAEEFARLWMESEEKRGMVLVLTSFMVMSNEGLGGHYPVNFHSTAWDVLYHSLKHFSNQLFSNNKPPTLLTLLTCFCSGSNFPKWEIDLPRMVRGRPAFESVCCFVRLIRGDVSLWDEDEPSGPPKLLTADPLSRVAARSVCTLLLSRRYCPERCSPLDVGLGHEYAEALVKLGNGDTSYEEGSVHECLAKLAKLSGMKNYKMLLYVAATLGEIEPCINDAAIRLAHRNDIIASFFLSCGQNPLSITGFSKTLKTRPETISELTKVLKGDTDAVPRLFFEAYEDSPIQKPGDDKAPEKEDLPVNRTTLIALTQLVQQDLSQLDWILLQADSVFASFPEKKVRTLIRSIVVNKDFAFISGRAQTLYRMIVATTPGGEWSPAERYAWLALQSLRGNPSALLQMMADSPKISEEVLTRAESLFGVTSGHVGLKVLLDSVKRIPLDIVSVIAEAGIGSQYQCFMVPDKDALRTPRSQLEFATRLNQSLGEDSASLMQNLVMMMCRNSRLRASIVDHLQGRLKAPIVDIFNLEAHDVQKTLLRSLVDVSYRRWRDAIPQIVMLTLQSRTKLSQSWDQLMDTIQLPGMKQDRDDVNAMTQTVRALIPPYDQEDTRKWYQTISEFVLRHSDRPQLSISKYFIQGVYDLVNATPQDGGIVKAVSELTGLLRQLCPAVTQDSVRAYMEIMAFNDCITNDVGDPIKSIQPIAMRLGEFPEDRIRALMRMVMLLRASNSLDLFAEITIVKTKIQGGENVDLFRFFDRRNDGVLDFNDFQGMLNFYSIKLSFEKMVAIFSKASEGKGVVTRNTFPILLDEITTIVINRTLDSMGFTDMNLAIQVSILVILLGTVQAFLVLGIRGFSDNSDLGATSSSLLPAGAGKAAFKNMNMATAVPDSNSHAAAAFATLTG